MLSMACVALDRTVQCRLGDKGKSEVQALRDERRGTGAAYSRMPHLSWPRLHSATRLLHGTPGVISVRIAIANKVVFTDVIAMQLALQAKLFAQARGDLPADPQ